MLNKKGYFQFLFYGKLIKICSGFYNQSNTELHNLCGKWNEI